MADYGMTTSATTEAEFRSLGFDGRDWDLIVLLTAKTARTRPVWCKYLLLVWD